jgi:adenylate cyclase
MDNRLPRKLAAILYADVAGYSRLTGDDEDATHRTLSEYLDLISAIVESHSGQVVHHAGDAVLAKFDAVVDAMSTAVTIQDELKTRSENTPDDRKIRFRIGVNSGDVIEDRGDIYGDGVNVAARLESLAEPGGICVSEAVRSALGKKLQLAFEDLGEQHVKNISEPVHAHHVRFQDDTSPRQPDSSSPASLMQDSEPSGGGKPSIAVLPFENMSSDPEQEYFVDGISEDIITGLSRFHSLLVVARNSSFSFRGQSMDVRDIGSKLGVRYVVEGSVRTSGKRVRVTSQLIDAPSGNHIWAERYDRDLEDIFTVQDELVRAIVTTVGGRIEEAGKTRAGRSSEIELQAYDLCLRAQSLQDRNTKEDYDRAEGCLLQAIEIDPNLTQAYHQLSLLKFFRWMVCWTSDLDNTFGEAFATAEQAVALDDTDSMVHAHLCMLHIYRREFEHAGHRIETAIRLNANDAKALGIYGFYLSAVGEPERAIDLFYRLAELNPVEPAWISRVKGIAYLTAGRDEEAISVLSSLQSPLNLTRGWLAASLANAGHADQARTTLDEFLRVAEREMLMFPGRDLEAWKSAWRGIQYKREEDSERFFEGLRKAGLRG